MMIMKRYLIQWTDGDTGKRRKASVSAMTKENAFNKLLKDERYEESLYLTFGKNIDKLGPDCVRIREIKVDDKKFNAIYM